MNKQATATCKLENNIRKCFPVQNFVAQNFLVERFPEKGRQHSGIAKATPRQLLLFHSTKFYFLNTFSLFPKSK